jgi:hypothetical protein
VYNVSTAAEKSAGFNIHYLCSFFP